MPTARRSYGTQQVLLTRLNGQQSSAIALRLRMFFLYFRLLVNTDELNDRQLAARGAVLSVDRVHCPFSIGPSARPFDVLRKGSFDRALSPPRFYLVSVRRSRSPLKNLLSGHGLSRKQGGLMHSSSDTSPSAAG